MKVFLNCHRKISASSAASIGSCPHLYTTVRQSLHSHALLLCLWIGFFFFIFILESSSSEARLSRSSGSM